MYKFAVSNRVGVAYAGRAGARQLFSSLGGISPLIRGSAAVSPIEHRVAGGGRLWWQSIKLRHLKTLCVAGREPRREYCGCAFATLLNARKLAESCANRIGGLFIILRASTIAAEAELAI